MLTRIVLALVAVLVVIQFIPISATNPSVTREVHWNSPETRALAQRSCFDCHSNLTTWPWYMRVAPASFLMADHVSEGRRDLDFSEWDRPQRAGFEEVQEEITDGDMPIWNYVLLHPEAKLSDAERARLIEGLRATFAQDQPMVERRRR